MSKTHIARRYYKDYSRLSRKEKQINDVWLVKCPYQEIGGYYKIRPCLVVGFTDENIIVDPITTQKKMNDPIEIIPPAVKTCYLSKKTMEIKEEYFLRKVGKKAGTQRKGEYITDYHKHGRK